MEAFMRHVLQRDFSDVPSSSKDLTSSLIVSVFKTFVQRQANLTAEWMRVGYTHGNMNSDNCLMCGKTLDYGPFAFMEAYSDSFQPFTSDHTGYYSFSRQPEAAQANARSFATALLALCKEPAQRTELEGVLEEVVETDFAVEFQRAHHSACLAKLGLLTWDDETRSLWEELLQLMEKSEVSELPTPFRQSSKVKAGDRPELLLEMLDM
eukprot:4882308-Amphidinium_carterae.1